MSKTECQRVAAGDVGEFVHEGFDRENISVSSQRSEGSVSYRRIEQEMVSDLLPRQFVRRHRIAVSVTERLRNMRRERFDEWSAQIPRGEKVHAAGLTRPHRMTVAPDIVRPVYDPSVGGERRFDPRRHSGAERCPGELVISHPLKLDGRACDGAGHQSRIQGHVVRAVVAVASCSGGVNDIDLTIIHSQHLGQISSQGKRALCVGPNRHAAVFQPRDRTGGAD